MKPYHVRRYIDRMGVDYGENVVLPSDIDTSECQEFFGMRCPHNVHIKGRRVAHVDRVDPRKNPIGHLKKDVGIPYFIITALVGAAIGYITTPNNRTLGALSGAGLLAIPGIIADITSSDAQ